jgi:hypothetical protein
MNEIYLISSDGYRDSIDLDFYATDEKGIILLVKNALSYFNTYLIEDSVEINYIEKNIRYSYIDYCDDEIEKGIYHLHIIKQIEK